VFNEPPDRQVAEIALSSLPLRHCLAILSRAAFTLATPSHAEMLPTQRELAPIFFSLETLTQVDDWIRRHAEHPDVYLFGEQQLLAAMTIAILKTKRFDQAPVIGPPFSGMGRALAHLSGLGDPLKPDSPEFAALSPRERERAFVPFILRNGIFYDQEDYRYVISRYYEMFVRIAPGLGHLPEFMDLPHAFRLATGLRLKTYLRFGVALLSSLHPIAKNKAGPALLDLERLRAPFHLATAWRKFMAQIMTSVRGYRKAHQTQLARIGTREYNFLAAEMTPIVQISKKIGCCLSLPFVERKFGPAIVHTIGSRLPRRESQRFRTFLGRVFERYVADLCIRCFPGLFVSNIRYGANLEGGDGWLLYPPAAILLEAKSSFLLLETKLSGDLEGFQEYFRITLLKAATQMSRVIDDFRAGRFLVAGLSPSVITRIYPVILTLHYLPLEKFLWNYINAELQAAGVLAQPGVEAVSILPVKDLEKIEALGGGFLDLVRDRLLDPAWREVPFSNFIFHRNSGRPDGFPNNPYLVGRFQDLLVEGGRQLFNVQMRGPT